MRHQSWTLKTFENGETDRVETGLSHEQAVRAIERAIRGLDPLGEEHKPLRAVEADTDTHLPVAA